MASLNEIEYFPLKVEDSLQNNQNYNMQNIFSNWKAISEAVVVAVLSAVLVYLSNLTKLTDFSLHSVEFIALTTFAGSLLKNLGTTPVAVATGTITSTPTTGSSVSTGGKFLGLFTIR